MMYTVGRFLSFLFLKLFVRLKARGQEHIPASGGFILASNHASNLDPVVLGVVCTKPLHFMAKEELFRNRFFGWILRSVNAFPLRRHGADTAAIKEAIRRVRRGGGLLIFPEGTRSVDGKLGPALEGVGFLAEKLKCPVIPAYVKGTERALPKGAKFIRPATISVVFGEPIFEERRVAYSDVVFSVMEAIKRLSCPQ